MNSSATELTTIRNMTLADVPAVVRVHLDAFPGFFLSFLGTRFLRLFYSETVRLGEVALVADVDGCTIGFVMGSTDPGQFFSRLIKRRVVGFALAALPALLKHPAAAGRLLRALLKPGQARRSAETATLMSLAVAPQSQAKGAGKQLVAAFIGAVSARGSTRVDLTTDKLQNDAANAFYRRLGFRVSREILTPEGRILNEYELELPHR